MTSEEYKKLSQYKLKLGFTINILRKSNFYLSSILYDTMKTELPNMKEIGGKQLCQQQVIW